MKGKIMLGVALFLSMTVLKAEAPVGDISSTKVSIGAELISPQKNTRRINNKEYDLDYGYGSSGKLMSMKVANKDSGKIADLKRQGEDRYRLNVKKGGSHEIYVIERKGDNYDIKYRNQTVDRKNLNFKNRENIFKFVAEYLER